MGRRIRLNVGTDLGLFHYQLASHRGSLIPIAAIKGWTVPNGIGAGLEPAEAVLEGPGRDKFGPEF
jgi:hypothetical protein